MADAALPDGPRKPRGRKTKSKRCLRICQVRSANTDRIAKYEDMLTPHEREKQVLDTLAKIAKQALSRRKEQRRHTQCSSQ